MIYTHRTQKSNYSKFFLEHNLVLEPDTEVETIDQVLPMIMNGLGIGFHVKITFTYIDFHIFLIEEIINVM